MLRQLFTLLALITGLAVSGEIASVQPAQAAEVACAAQAETACVPASAAQRLAIAPALVRESEAPVEPAAAVATDPVPATRVRVDRALE